jgi:hypothetical protein
MKRGDNVFVCGNGLHQVATIEETPPRMSSRGILQQVLVGIPTNNVKSHPNGLVFFWVEKKNCKIISQNGTSAV